MESPISRKATPTAAAVTVASQGKIFAGKQGILAGSGAGSSAYSEAFGKYADSTALARRARTKDVTVSNVGRIVTLGDEGILAQSESYSQAFSRAYSNGIENNTARSRARARRNDCVAGPRCPPGWS